MYQASKFFVFFLVLAGCATQPKMGTVNPFRDGDKIQTTAWAAQNKLPSFRVIFSGNVNGQLDPCGCSVNPKGGLDRRLNFVRADQSSHKIILDAGNALFAAKQLDKGQAANQRARAQAVLKGHALMGVAAQNVGILDLSAGLKFLKDAAADAKIKLISTNLVNTKREAIFETQALVDISPGLQVAVFGITGDADSLPDGLTVLDPFASLYVPISKLAPQTPVIILSDLGQSQDQELALKFKRPVLIIGSHDLSSLEIPTHQQKALLVQGQFQGQQWGVLDLAWNKDAKGWYNPRLSTTFKGRWETIQKELQEYGPSNEHRVEKERLTQALHALQLYAPVDLKEKTLYDYRLVDLTVEYAKPNELTAVMQKLKQK